MKTNAGVFDVLININKPNESRNQSNEVIFTNSLHFTTWAERKQVTKSEKEEYEARQLVSSDYTEFKIRFPRQYTIPTTKMVIEEVNYGFKYDIENIRVEGRNEFLILVCKQQQQR